jgi:phosphatidate cytidylyltransferase
LADADLETKKLSDLGTRAAVGVGLILVTLLALTFGGLVWWALTMLIGLGMLVEWLDLARAGLPARLLAIMALALGLALAAPFLWGADRSVVAAIVGLALLVAVLSNNTRLGFGLTYAGLPVVALLFLRDQPNGFALTLWTLAIVWATDIGAYFAGRGFGGPKLAPRLSPKKTWSGLIGGVVVALIVGLAVAITGHLPLACIWLGAPLAVLAQIGDIYESHLKRQAGVKDSSALLPGHGGLLDRLDGLVPVAIVVGALVSNGNLAG